jgi:hypothetical protein
VSVRNLYGVLSAPVVLVNLPTTLPGAPAAPSGLTAISSGTRTKRWKWTHATEKDIAGYEYQVWTASGRTGTKKEPSTGDVNGPHGFRRATSHTYTESGMARTTVRYLSIRAKNRAGVVSAWSEASSANSDYVQGSSGGAASDVNPTGTGAIGGGDVGTREITDPNGGSLSGYSVTTTNAQKISQTVTLNAGVVVILVGGNITMNGGSAINVTMEIRRGASVLKTISLFSINSSVLINVPMHAHHIETPGLSGSFTYSVWMVLSGTPTSCGGDISLTVIEFKR